MSNVVYYNLILSLFHRLDVAIPIHQFFIFYFLNNGLFKGWWALLCTFRGCTCGCILTVCIHYFLYVHANAVSKNYCLYMWITILGMRIRLITTSASPLYKIYILYVIFNKFTKKMFWIWYSYAMFTLV